MGLMCVVILCFSMTLIKLKANRIENQVFAIPGCNATLEWTLAPTYLTSYVYSINVFNANGTEIAMMEHMKCQQVIIDTSMYCEVRNISDKEWRLTVVLINVTRAHSGKYLGNIKSGLWNETRTNDLKIIDKPQIRETQKPFLLKPFSTKCTVDSEFDDLKYHWKLNGTYLNSTERINASSSNLTFSRLMMTDKFSLFSCTVCLEMNCCIESEHYAPDPYYLSTVASSLDENKGQHLELYWTGPSIASFFLLIIGIVILFTLRRKYTSREIVPAHSSRLYKEHLNSDNSVNNKRRSEENNCPWPFSVTPSVRGSILVKRFATGNGDNRVAHNDDNTVAKSQTPNSSKRDNSESGLQEDLYNTIDEADVSVYNYKQDSLFKETSHMAGRSTEHEQYHYAISVELHQDTMAGINEIDQTYMTPISDLFRPIKKCENDESNGYLILEKDQDATSANYSTPTPISDFPSPIKICQAEDTDLHGTDPSYITPVTDREDKIEIRTVVDLDL